MIFKNSVLNKKVLRVTAHATAWLLYGIFIYLANYLTQPSLHVIKPILFLLPHCITFYVSLYCLNMYKRIGILWSIASFFIVFVIMSSVAYLYLYFLLPDVLGVYLYDDHKFRTFLKAAILGYVQYFSYATLYFYLLQSWQQQKIMQQMHDEKLKNELENARLKEQELKSQKEKLTIEYAFLRSQVNPHFLHNTLNHLFSQALEYSQPLADNISRLSRIMRYSLEGIEDDTDKVSVQKELDILALLIAIYKARLGESAFINYSISGTTGDQLIPKLSLITLVENAFKYGDPTDPLHPLEIRVIQLPGLVKFYCSNKKRQPFLNHSSHQIGQSNLRKRLDIAFKGKYKMRIEESGQSYAVELIVNM